MSLLDKCLQLVLPNEVATEVLTILHNSSTASHLGVRKKFSQDSTGLDKDMM